MSAVAPAAPAEWQQYGAQSSDGADSALAILLTDPASAWLGLAHGLKTIGVPFVITTDPTAALRHRVVLVYPTISGKVLSREALQALAAFPRQGGTLIGFGVEGGGLEPVFGFAQAIADRAAYELRFDLANPVAAEFTDPRERAIRINPQGKSALDMGVFGYTQPLAAPLAVYDSGMAAILHRAVGSGHAYAFGIDLGFFLLKGYNGRQEGISRAYANTFEPSLDVLLRLLRNIYEQGEPDAVTLGTVPGGRPLTVILTHDVDYSRSMANSLEYARHQQAEGMHATYFIQTKYVRDWNDDAFFNPQGVENLKALAALGAEIGSHSVSHSRVFSKFALGSGGERYPSYRPFVRDAEHTSGGTILGELRVSRFLLERVGGVPAPVSFRPGYLELPFSLPQALQAAGYRYSSSVSANMSLTHLPFRLAYDRSTQAQTAVYEFPITVEDELPPRMGERLPQALELAERLSRYGGLFVVLTHPDVLEHKLEFQRGLVAALKHRAAFASLREFGEWWAARDQIRWQVRKDGARRTLALDAPRPLSGLALRVPAGYRYVGSEPALQARQTGRNLLIVSAEGKIVLQFRSSSAN